MEQIAKTLYTNNFTHFTLNLPIALAVEKHHQCEVGILDGICATLDSCNVAATART